MNTKYDAIVVGAGPAGSTAARFMAKAGMQVLLIDRKTEIGHIKRCGEGIGLHNLKAIGMKPNDLWIRSNINGALLYSPDGTSVKVTGYKGFVIERKVFDKYLAIEAAKAGANVRAANDVMDLIMDGKKISGVVVDHLGKKESIYADLIIAADGVDSVLARKAGLNTTINLFDITSCAEYEMSNVEVPDAKKIAIYLGNEIAPGGYAWVFPKGDSANVGLGVRASIARTAIDYLKNFVQKMNYNNGSIIEVNIGAVPVGGPPEKWVKDNFMVVGDAARQVNPIHGGGIGLSMSSAKIVGSVAVAAWKEKDYSEKNLHEYDKLWDKEFGKKMSKLLALRKFIEKLGDEEMNELAALLNSEDVMELMAGKFVSFVKLMRKNPKMIKYVPALLKLA
ncbi:MAG: NAD(P)/FAD-dependent oxidoreductase [Candidatus Aenigmatarchaeota archaeon]